ncbi:MAG: S8 family serine peptidase [Candidatus Limnocylindrales bacterium]|jgi:serine protease AprX
MVLVDRLHGSPRGNDPTERGWSLGFVRSGVVAAGVSALLVVSALAPLSAFAADTPTTLVGPTDTPTTVSATPTDTPTDTPSATPSATDTPTDTLSPSATPTDTPSPSAAPTGYNPLSDGYSMYNTTAWTGASAWWNAGYTGQGVDVALIDTGVSPVEGLASPGKIVYGPDLSLESQAPNLTNLDTNGHGTFMAGLIAGRDSTLNVPYASAPASAYRGIAPDARIVSIKVGVADGGTDVSQVIAAIDWVVQHKNDNGLNIRVINLSYGTNSSQAYRVDPLSYAVEQAWKAGIVVVAAAGNTGYQIGARAPGLADPAYNPYVIAVGSYDTAGTASLADDFVGPFSASSARCGAACRAPDFVAVGAHLQGLRVPNGYLDVTHPEGQLGDRYFRGSGTSEATAITSGSIALLLQKFPTMSPDKVKKFLTNNAANPNGWKPVAAGAGELNMSKLLTHGNGPVNYAQTWPSSTGTGTLEGARGTDHLTANGVVLMGEQDIFGQPFDSKAMAAAEAAGTSWSGGMWNGSSWSGSSWSGSSWSGNSWSGSSWSGSSWSGNSWSGNSWSGSSWSGSSWSGSSWSGSSWSGCSWS